jgi:hypothetical protein
MPEPETGKAERQEAAVSAFVYEHRPIVGDPEAGYSALSRVYTGGADLLSAVSSHTFEVANLATDAANRLTAAISDPHCSASKVNEREKEYARRKAEIERLATTFGRLDAFLGEVKARLDTEFDETGVRTQSVAEAEEAPSVAPDRTTPHERRSSWLRRLLGART